VSAERAPRPNLADLPSAIGNIIIAAAITLSIAARASLGFYFSYFAVVSRLVLGLLYFG
jgi:NCS1 family nucleobase:cation symporter-1